MKQVIMEAESLQGYLTSKDNAYLKKLDELYNQTMQQFTRLDTAADIKEKDAAETEIIALYDKMGKILQEICKEVPQLKVYSFITDFASHAEASRVMAKLRSSETADLFIALAIYRLKTHGRAAIIIPDGFLFGNDGAKTALKTRLLTDYNLHTIIRLPSGVFAPYTSITTNILFFDKPAAGETPGETLWYYRVDIPNGWNAFSKTRPFQPAHLADCVAWWHNRTEIADEQGGGFKARAYNKAELLASGVNLDLCGYSNDETEVLNLAEAFRQYEAGYRNLERQIDESLKKIRTLMGIDLPAEDE